MRKLTKVEKDKIELLTRNSVSLSLLEPTKTGLKKSILDATGPVRDYLDKLNIHNYSSQKQGKDYKKIIAANIITEDGTIKSRASLYRPKTKKGDPRIWFKNLREITYPNDIIALLWFDSMLQIFNLSKLNIKKLLEGKQSNVLKDIVEDINEQENLIADELLFKLRKIAKQGFVPSMVTADTGIGRTLETMLGIPINSSKKPDYKGIELKSYRSKRNNRKNLFAQVPNWTLSKFKSSTVILDNFGYKRHGDFQLRCTVSTITRNSQGLKLKIDHDLKRLLENSDKKNIGDFAVWTLDKLHQRLITKHNETFWISADSKVIDNQEYYHYKLVEHTKKPIVSQFNILLEDGTITMDHLIKRTPTGSGKEKGPLFKIKPKGVNLLFPPSKKYDLLA